MIIMMAELSRLAAKKPIGAAATGNSLLLHACYDSMHAVFLLRKHAHANNSVEHRTNKLSCHAKHKTCAALPEHGDRVWYLMPAWQSLPS
jgi:hypothetical protein